jgi:hypothetical protein
MPSFTLAVSISMSPALITLRTAPTSAAPVAISAPIPAGAMPAVKVPAMPVSAKDPFGFLDKTEPLDGVVLDYTPARRRSGRSRHSDKA